MLLLSTIPGGGESQQETEKAKDAVQAGETTTPCVGYFQACLCPP
jgi:hypothetical protein